MLLFFLQTSSLVASEILRRQSPSSRATVIEKWAAVGEVCRNLHNFNSVLEITSAFMSSSIFRLKKTWEKVSKQVSTQLCHLFCCRWSINSWVCSVYVKLRQKLFVPVILFSCSCPGWFCRWTTLRVISQMAKPYFFASYYVAAQWGYIVWVCGRMLKCVHS